MADEFLNADGYFRFMCFSAVELTIGFPLGLYQLLTDAFNKNIFPWIPWGDTHYHFDRYDQLPATYFDQGPILSHQVHLLVAETEEDKEDVGEEGSDTLLKPFGPPFEPLEPLPQPQLQSQNLVAKTPPPSRPPLPRHWPKQIAPTSPQHRQLPRQADPQCPQPRPAHRILR